MEKQITWSIRFIALFICSLSFLNAHAQKKHERERDSV